MLGKEKASGTFWMGWVLTVLVTLFLLADGLFSVLAPKLAPDALRPMVEEGGFRLEQAPTLGIIMLISAILYVIPRTASLGAILVTGFLGGAVATEVRIGGTPWEWVCIALGVLAWGGLYLRDVRVRALLPLRS